MRQLITIFIFLLITKGIAQTNISGGNVNGTWTKSGSPYKINGNITIQNGQTLIIEPGVRIEFAQLKYLSVDGRIVAIGGNKSTDSIWFTKQNTHDTGSWKGVRFINTANTNDTSTFKYCVFRNCKSLYDSSWNNISGGLRIRGFGKVKVLNSTFYKNEANLGASMFITYGGFARVISCTFKNNKTAIFSFWTTAPTQYLPKGSAIYVHGNGRCEIDSSLFKDNINGKDYRTNTNILGDASVVEAQGEYQKNRTAIINISNCTFDNNFGNNLVAFNKGEVTVSKSIFKNSPYDKYARLLYSFFYGVILTRNCIFTNNQAFDIVMVEGAKYYSYNDVFYKNQNFDGLISSKNETGSGSPYVSLMGTMIYNNDYGPIHKFNGGLICSNLMWNCLIANNNTKRLIRIGYAYNSTIVNNHSSEYLINVNDYAIMKNCIVWGNQCDSMNGRQIQIRQNSFAYFYNNIIPNDTSNFWLTPGYVKGWPDGFQNNMDTNPFFKNPTSGIGTAYQASLADFSLQNSCLLSSPAINAGSTDTNLMKIPKTDLLGNNRYNEGRLDIGAYEDNVGSAKINIVRNLNSDSFCLNSRSASLNLSAFGQGLSYNWQQSSNGGNSWSSANGASNNDTFIKPNTKVAENGLFYRVILNGTCDNDTSNSVSITTFNLPVYSLGNDTAVCSGEEISKSISIPGTYIWQSGNTFGSMKQKIFKDSLWTAQITNSKGCSFKDSIQITVKPLPLINLGPDQNLHKLKSILLDAGVGHSTYLWNDASTAQTKTFFGQDLGPAGTYLIWAEVKSMNSCISRDSISITVTENSGLDITQQKGFKVYPQPVNNNIIVSGENIESVQIYGLDGKLVIFQRVNDNKIDLDVCELTSGVYLLAIVFKDGKKEIIKWNKL